MRGKMSEKFRVVCSYKCEIVGLLDGALYGSDAHHVLVLAIMFI